jgi:ribosomal protein S6--L-glutamate ligase
MRIVILVARSRADLSRLGPLPDEILLLLRGQGHEVLCYFGEDKLTNLDEWPPPADLFILKGHDALCQSLAGLAAARGGLLLNPHQSCIQAENKILATARLRAAGLPAPESWVTTGSLNLNKLASRKSLIVKPHIGGMGRSAHAHKISYPADVNSIDLGSDTFVTQEFIAGPGADLKVYVVGDRVFGIRKPSTGLSFNIPGIRCELTTELVELAGRVGDVLGLGLFGMDVIESPAGPVVVDVNYFPSYAGIEEAPMAIADYIIEYGRGAYRLIDGGRLPSRTHLGD